VQEEIKAKWVAALRSGDYKQTKYEFFDGECHCAIGVLLDISGAGRWDAFLPNFGIYHFVLEGSFKQLFDAMKIDPVDRANVMRMNDSRDRSFAESADYVEREL
jgi:hypothetical protein